MTEREEFDAWWDKDPTEAERLLMTQGMSSMKWHALIAWQARASRPQHTGGAAALADAEYIEQMADRISFPHVPEIAAHIARLKSIAVRLAVPPEPAVHGPLVHPASTRRQEPEAADGDRRWIAVSVRLPEPDVSVIAFWPPKDGKVHAGCFATATCSSPTHWHNPEDDDDDYIEPSHWMPLPASPLSDPTGDTPR